MVDEYEFWVESDQYTHGGITVVNASNARLIEDELNHAVALLREVRYEVYNKYHRNDSLVERISDFNKRHGTRLIPESSPPYDDSPELKEARSERDRMRTLAGELIAAIRINFLRGTLKGGTEEQLEDFLKQFIDRLNSPTKT
jgi:hypothetical protein